PLDSSHNHERGPRLLPKDAVYIQTMIRTLEKDLVGQRPVYHQGKQGNGNRREDCLRTTGHVIEFPDISAFCPGAWKVSFCPGRRRYRRPRFPSRTCPEERAHSWA